MAQQTENNNMTAVEWLAKEIYARGPIDWPIPTWLKELYDKANELHKKQIKECWDVAHQAGRFEGKGIAEENWQTFEQYYNETFGKS